MHDGEHGASTPAFVIGVASGKTTVSRRIWEAVGRERIAYVQHDNYYKDQSHLSPEDRALTNYDHPDSLETSLMVRHLRELRAGRPVDIPVYDFSIHNRSKETLRINPAKVVLVEGILIFVEPDLRELMDMRIFVDTDADIRFIRRLRRDMVERGRTLDSVVKQYLATVRPMHEEFVEPSKRYADVIVPQGGDNRVAMEMIASRIQALLNE